MKFPCTSCGCCCKRVGLVIKVLGAQQKGHPLYFPHEINSNGYCSQLTSENVCAVYENRPLICRVDDLADIISEGSSSKRESFIEENIKVCNQMMEEDGISEEYRIKPKNI